MIFVFDKVQGKVVEKHMRTPRPGVAPVIVSFPAGYFRDLGPEPVYVESAAQLRQECASRGKYSVYLENSGVYRGNMGQKREV